MCRTPKTNYVERPPCISQTHALLAPKRVGTHGALAPWHGTRTGRRTFRLELSLDGLAGVSRKQESSSMTGWYRSRIPCVGSPSPDRATHARWTLDSMDGIEVENQEKDALFVSGAPHIHVIPVHSLNGSVFEGDGPYSFPASSEGDRRPYASPPNIIRTYLDGLFLVCLVQTRSAPSMPTARRTQTHQRVCISHPCGRVCSSSDRMSVHTQQ